MAELSAKSEVKLDIKTLIGRTIGIEDVDGRWFELKAKIRIIDTQNGRVLCNKN